MEPAAVVPLNQANSDVDELVEEVLELDGNMSEDVGNGLDGSNVDRMLVNSVKATTLKQYSRMWDKWATFASLHGLKVIPPKPRSLEIFIADSAEFSSSAAMAQMACAAVTHFCALAGVSSPFDCPRFGKIIRGSSSATARRPGQRGHSLPTTSSSS